MRMSSENSRRRSLAVIIRVEGGFTLVEVVVAILILAIGMTAVIQVFDTSTRNAYRAEQSQVALNVAQRELEEIRNLDYDAIALTSAPTFVEDENDPRNRVDGTRFDVSANGTYAEMVFNGGALQGGGEVTNGAVSSGPEEFRSGDVTGTIHRFIVWRNDPTCSEEDCPGPQDLKRGVVAVKLDTVAISHERPYIEVQSDFIDPDEGRSAGPPDPGGEVVVAQQFWPTDTTCDNATRQPIQTDGGDLPQEGHELHNTLGVCAHGPNTGTEAGAPDLLDLESPPDPTPDDPTDPPIYDYSTDVERPPDQPDDDGGIQMPRQDVNGCDFTGGNHQQTHRWVTRPIDVAALPGGFVMDGAATLEVFLRTIGGAQHPATLCVFLFQRELESPDSWTDVVIDGEEFLVNAVPSADWDRVRIPMTFTRTTIQPGERLGLAIGIEREGTPADTVQILYDHPEARTRLEVETPTPLGE